MRGDGRIFKRGSRFWLAYYAHGREVRESAGTTDKEARQKLRTRLVEIHGGRFIGPEQERLTIGELLDALLVYLENKGAKSPTYKYHVAVIRRWFGLERAVKIHAARVDRFIAEEKREGKAVGTINRELTFLKLALNLAKKQGRLSQVPYLPLLREDNIREGFFEHDAFLRVVRHLPAYLADLAWFGYLTGWRKGEIVGLTWEVVDRAAGEIRLTTSKSGHGRFLPLEGDLKVLIEKRWAAREVRRRDGTSFLSPYVFHLEGHPIGDIRKAWKTACKKAEVPGKLFHDLRRTAVRNMVRAGVPQTVAMSISGHRTVSMFYRYNITSAADQREAFRRVSTHLEAQEGANPSNVVAIR